MTDGHVLRSFWPSRSLLGRLTPEARQNLIGRCRPVSFSPGERLINQGDRHRHAIVLYVGVVKIHLVDRTGYEGLLAIRQRGEIVGELAALSGLPRTAPVVAVRRVAAGMVSGQSLAGFLVDHPAAARELIRIQGERLEWANRRRADFAARSAASKIARVLADLAADTDEFEGSYRIELTQQDLASIVGIALQTAQRALRALAMAGLVERRYRAVAVADLRRLVEFAEGCRNP